MPGLSETQQLTGHLGTSWLAHAKMGTKPKACGVTLEGRLVRHLKGKGLDSWEHVSVIGWKKGQTRLLSLTLVLCLSDNPL